MQKPSRSRKTPDVTPSAPIPRALPGEETSQMSTGLDRIRQARAAVQKAEEEAKAAVAAMTRVFEEGYEVSFHLDGPAMSVTMTSRRSTSLRMGPPEQQDMTMPLPVAAAMAQYVLEVAESAQQGAQDTDDKSA
jgi:hypothetical protein